MNAPFRPSLAADDTDTRHAKAFRDLESQVCDARAAAIAVELIWNDAGNPGSLGHDAGRRLGMPDYTVLILTEDQFQAMHYLMRRARDEAELLRTAYYAGFGGQATP